MSDPKLAELLKWGVQNSDASRSNPNDHQSQTSTSNTTHGLSADALAALLGGPSDADRMREAMTAILADDVDVENKIVAFDNFEQLIENIDNANNMEALGLWVPLVQQLHNSNSELRSMAAWCLGTAVQNNDRAQERLLVVGAIPKLVQLATEDSVAVVRKKAILALSSEVRNYQPGLDEMTKNLPEGHAIEGKVDAADMEAVDKLIQGLRDSTSLQTMNGAS